MRVYNCGGIPLNIFPVDFIPTSTLRGAVTMLDKYVDILQAHVMQTLSLSYDIVSTDVCHFARAVAILEQGVAGTLS